MPELRPYQREAAERMAATTRLYLAFRPRMGKTPTTIVACTLAGVERPVVVCPAIAREVWQRHWAEWGLPSVMPRVVSYDQIVRNPALEEELTRVADCLIVDEVHYGNHLGSKRSRAAARMMNRVERVYPLSGSPIRTRPFDLYPVLRAVWGDKLSAIGTLHARQFSEMFEEQLYAPARRYAAPKVRAKNVPLLRSLLEEVMIRTTREQVAEQLPPVAWERVRLELDPGSVNALNRALRDQIEPEELVAILEALERGELPAEGRATATARRILGTAKAPLVAAAVGEELEAKLLDKVVVLAYHLDVLDVLEFELSPWHSVRIDGSTAPHQRAQAIHEFQHGSARVFLGQITATGLSIDLSAADDVILVEEMWVPEDNMQAVDRIRSPNKDRPCVARSFVVPGSIDEAVARVNARRMKIAGRVIYGDD